MLSSLIITKNVASKSPKGDNTLLGSIPLLLVPTSLRLCGNIWLLGDTPNSASSVPLLFYIANTSRHFSVPFDVRVSIEPSALGCRGSISEFSASQELHASYKFHSLPTSLLYDTIMGL